MYKSKADKYKYIRDAAGLLPPWPVDWINKSMRPVMNGQYYWSGDATAKSIQFSFKLNKDGTIPANRRDHLQAAILRLEGNVPADARVDTDSSDGAPAPASASESSDTEDEF